MARNKGVDFLWKLYAWFIGGIASVSFLLLDWHDWWEIGRLVIDLIGVAGLFAFAYGRSLGTRTAWLFWLAISVPIEFWAILSGHAPSGWALLISGVTILPLYGGICLFALRLEEHAGGSRLNKREDPGGR